jgi:hypothetical protein
MGAIAFAGFWVMAIWLWVDDGPKIPLIFIGLWFAALFGFPLIGLSGFLFVAFEAVLAAILLVIQRSKARISIL